MYRVEVIQQEMASAVRVLGGNGPAKEQITKASLATGLTVTIIERLRWRKIKRVPADIADTVRAALDRYDKETRSRAEHLLWLAQQENQELRKKLAEHRIGDTSEGFRRNKSD